MWAALAADVEPGWDRAPAGLFGGSLLSVVLALFGSDEPWEKRAHRCHVDGWRAREDELCILEEAAFLPVSYDGDAVVGVSENCAHKRMFD